MIFLRINIFFNKYFVNTPITKPSLLLPAKNTDSEIDENESDNACPSNEFKYEKNSSFVVIQLALKV